VSAPVVHAELSACRLQLINASPAALQILSEYRNAQIRGSEFANLPSIRMGERKVGKFGGHLLKIVRVEPQWYSRFASIKSGIDPQGDPRWPIFLFGEELARFLGFELIDDRSMWLPDITELNGALEKLSNTLGDKSLTLRFYAQTKPFANEYASRFANDFQLPIADPNVNLNHFIHDYAYHVAAILVPESFFDSGRLLFRQSNSFVRHLRQLGNDVVPESLVTEFDRLLSMYFAAAYDLGTGTLISYWQGTSPNDLYRTVVRHLVGMDAPTLWRSSLSASRLHDNMEDLAKIEQQIEPFMAQHQLKDMDDLPRFHEFQIRIGERRKQMEMAVHEILRRR